MADFRKKLFGLASAVTMFTGMAFGQYCNTTGGGTVSLAPVNGASFIRSEGQTELLPALVFSCTNGAPQAATLVNLTVYLSPAVSITSKLLSGSTSNTEASAVIGGTVSATGVVTGGTTYPGVVVGSSVTFSNISLGAGAGTAESPIIVGNIRVNASALPGNSAGTLPSPITAQAFVSSGTTSGSTVTVTPGASNATNVAYSFSGFGPNSGKAYNSTGFTSQNFSSYGVCGSINNSSTTGSALPGASGNSGSAIYVDVVEGFQNAFKTLAEEAGNVTASAAAANSGTRVTMTFNGIPANLAIYLPQTVTVYNTATPPVAISQITLMSSATAPSGAANATTIATSPASVNTLGLVQIPVSGTTATATYEVTLDQPSAIDQYTVPVYLQAATNTLAAGSTLSITTGLAPQPATAASLIPSFSSTAASIVTTNTIPFVACQTNLLFPFVTNANGFETGIAIANTSKDPFSTKNQSGTCTLNYYSSGVSGATNPTAVTAPNLTEGANQPYLAGEDYAFTLTQSLAVNAANPAVFQGYIIAQCNFSYAHAFAYILGGLQPGMFVNPNNTAMGYLAIVLPSSRSTSSQDSAGN